MNYSLVLYGIIFGILININAFAQTSSGNASATIIQPVNLLKVRDMSFGNIASGETPGTVTIAPTEASIRTTTGGASLPAGSGTVYSAKFILSGAEDNNYSIILPSAPNIVSNGTNFMTIDNFKSTPSGSGTFTSGAIIICVGATIHVDENQEEGVYESTAGFVVTVNYN